VRVVRLVVYLAFAVPGQIHDQARDEACTEQPCNPRR